MSAEQAEEDPRFLPAVALLAPQLPVVARLRLAAASKGCGAVLAAAAPPVRCDLSAASGVRAGVTDAELRAAVALATDGLQVLDVHGCAQLTRDALRAVLTAHAPTLREVYCGGAEEEHAAALLGPELPVVQGLALLARAPHLRAIEARLTSTVADAGALLLAVSQRPALRARLVVTLILRLSDSLRAHGVNFAAALRAGELFPPMPPPFAGAVRASCCGGVSFAFLGGFHGLKTAPALLAALQAHARLRCVEAVLPGDAFKAEEGEDGGQRRPLAEALGALVGADPPTLRELRLRTPRALAADDVAPLAEALRLNTHLERLDVGGGAAGGDDDDDAFDAFARDCLLPAAAACPTLRALRFCPERRLPALADAFASS